MNDHLLENAKRLASCQYIVEVKQDETTDGQPIFLAIHPEIPGCLAQGETVEEAVENLNDARLEYILSLLEDGLPVPSPNVTSTGNPKDSYNYKFSNEKPSESKIENQLLFKAVFLQSC